jgi:carbohydrate-binding DOMON domain-containing protein
VVVQGGSVMVQAWLNGGPRVVWEWLVMVQKWLSGGLGMAR